jgi:hypothetical protein
LGVGDGETLIDEVGVEVDSVAIAISDGTTLTTPDTSVKVRLEQDEAISRVNKSASRCDDWTFNLVDLVEVAPLNTLSSLAMCQSIDGLSIVFSPACVNATRSPVGCVSH